MLFRYSVLILFIVFVRCGNATTIAQRLSHFIFPGTNWCGIGSIAKDYNDLGPDKELDMCCREHDKCPIELNPGDKKFGLENTYFISRLHCRCDKKFYNCLKNLTSPVANLIGNIYFNILRYPCFAGQCFDDFISPWGECINARTQYYNEKTRRYQWYDIQPYKR